MTDKTDALTPDDGETLRLLDSRGDALSVHAAELIRRLALAAPAEGAQGEVIDATSNPEYLRELALLLNQRGLSDAALPLPAIAAHYESLIDSAGGAKGEQWEPTWTSDAYTIDHCNKGDTPQPAEGDGAVLEAVAKYVGKTSGIYRYIRDDLAKITRPAATAVVPEGCTPEDARMLRVANHELAEESSRFRTALEYYADRNHFALSDLDAWDTVSGEPSNLWCDNAGTATVEDGATARLALAAAPKGGVVDGFDAWFDEYSKQNYTDDMLARAAWNAALANQEQRS